LKFLLDYLNALEQDLLNNPNQEHYNQQENTPNVNYDITSVNHYEPGNTHKVCMSQCDIELIINLRIKYRLLSIIIFNLPVKNIISKIRSLSNYLW